MSDRLYDLVPYVYKQRDADAGYPLRALLRVIAVEVNALEEDIARTYENWFIETCEEWVVPYIGDLLGFQPVHAARPGSKSDADAMRRNRFLAPRRDVANFVRAHARRGTLALLEVLSHDAARLPSRAVERYTQLAWTQSLNSLHLARGRTADLRDVDALDLLDTPFDAVAHSVDGRENGANIPNVADYAWRLRSYPVTNAPAYFLQRGGGYFFYTFSAFGNDAPLFTKAVRERESTTIAGELNVPTPIRRRAFERQLGDYYGLDENGGARSVMIWKDGKPLPRKSIVAADLSDWFYRPPKGHVAVDPRLGRMAFAEEPKREVRVSYRYGFSADVGAGEYTRRIAQSAGAVIFRVGAQERFTTISDAIEAWNARDPRYRHAVIEIADSDVYTPRGSLTLEIASKNSLQIRAANRCRPIINLLDYSPSRGEALNVVLHDGARFTLDGVVVSGRPLRVDGADGKTVDARVDVRHCTLVPGWSIHRNCEPDEPSEASIDVNGLRGTLSIDATITGTIAVSDRTAEGEPLTIRIRDSIVDATAETLEAIHGPGRAWAYAALTIVRSTVIGTIDAHAIDLAENTIFMSPARVVRRQRGCVRFSWVPPGSRTPRRYHCQPDLVEEAAPDDAAAERLRVEPRFNSVRFGAPDYCQLASDCAAEILRGADDQSEMGVFHDLFFPQRAAALRARLDDYTPAGMHSGIVYAD